MEIWDCNGLRIFSLILLDRFSSDRWLVVENRTEAVPGVRRSSSRDGTSRMRHCVAWWPNSQRSSTRSETEKRPMGTSKGHQHHLDIILLQQFEDQPVFFCCFLWCSKREGGRTSWTLKCLMQKFEALGILNTTMINGCFLFGCFFLKHWKLKRLH